VLRDRGKVPTRCTGLRLGFEMFYPLPSLVAYWVFAVVVIAVLVAGCAAERAISLHCVGECRLNGSMEVDVVEPGAAAAGAAGAAGAAAAKAAAAGARGRKGPEKITIEAP